MSDAAARLNRTLDEMLASHAARVSELLAANNREVERRRAAESWGRVLEVQRDAAARHAQLMALRIEEAETNGILPLSSWRTMDTAPRNAVIILMARKGRLAERMCWLEGASLPAWYRADATPGASSWFVTPEQESAWRWLPLPQAPAAWS